MDKFEKLNGVLKDFITQKLKEHYSFELWKETYVAYRVGDLHSVRKHWKFFNKNFIVTDLDPEMEFGDDEWLPSIYIEFHWKINDLSIPVEATVIKDDVISAGLSKKAAAEKLFGDDFDFEEEFKSKILNPAKYFGI